MTQKLRRPHFLIVTYPAPGHLNPGLQFAERLIRTGALVTYVTCVSAYRRKSKIPTPDGLSFTTFSDGYDDGFDASKDDAGHYISAIKRRGSETLNELIKASENEGRPITRLVYTLLLPWVADVGREMGIPYSLLWLQPALVFDIYYYMFKGHGDFNKEKVNESSCLIELPGLPTLSYRDLPFFSSPKNIPNAYSAAVEAFKEQIETIAEESNPKILVNTFDTLEPESLRAIDNINMIAVGPLIPPVFLDEKDPSDTSPELDLFDSSKDYMAWLNSKPKSSVIYVSFGSMCVLEKHQMEEIARGLLDSGHPFLWVIRAKANREKEKEEDELIKHREELNDKGMIVPWCSQVEVLSHASLGCFITHCGWNSSLETLVSGVPVVAFPQWTDQRTNAKILEDFCKTGVRVNANEEGIIESDEIKKCLDLVMGEGEKGQELRGNAKKWKDLAIQAAKEGGSSDKNLKDFVDEVGGLCL